MIMSVHLSVRYWQAKPIGSGANGEVISASDSLLHGKGTIKTIKGPSIAALEAKLFDSRFRGKICLLTPLQHQNIVQVLDCDTVATAVEQLRQISLLTHRMRLDLHQLIPMNHQRAADRRIISHRHIPHLLSQLLLALKWIHSVKVSHGDLKPRNIFVDLHGHRRISDLALAQGARRGGGGGSNADHYLRFSWQK